MAVDETAQKAQPFSHVVPVIANVAFHDTSIDGEKLGHVCGLGKEISGMAELRCLDNRGPLKIEDVFGPKQVKATSTFAELVEIEGVIVWLPSNQRDVEIPRHA